MCKKISLDNLNTLINIYKRNWPKHVVIISTLETFSKIFDKFPELIRFFNLFVVSDDWKETGEFYAIVSDDTLSEASDITIFYVVSSMKDLISKLSSFSIL